MSEYGFKVPVSGQKIPHGWFAALVRFMNSLILSGDGTWTMVSRDEAGTQVTLTPSAVAALKKAAGGPPAAGAAQDLSVSVSGNTATVDISGSTSHVDFVGAGAVNISGNTNGEIEIDVPGGTGSNVFFPDYGETPVPVSDGTVYPVNNYMWLIGYVGLYKKSTTGFPSSVVLNIMNLSGTVITRTFTLFADTGVFSSYSNNNSFDVPVCLPVKSGYSIEVIKTGSVEINLALYHV
jgi:hypothetical protein